MRRGRITDKRMRRLNQAYDFIVRYMSENGWSPSMREIAEELRTSPSVALDCVRQLESLGMVVRGDGNRMIRPIERNADE